jgi:hypothetical protein
VRRHPVPLSLDDNRREAGDATRLVRRVDLLVVASGPCRWARSRQGSSSELVPSRWCAAAGRSAGTVPCPGERRSSPISADGTQMSRSSWLRAPRLSPTPPRSLLFGNGLGKLHGERRRPVHGEISDDRRSSALICAPSDKELSLNGGLPWRATRHGAIREKRLPERLRKQRLSPRAGIHPYDADHPR